MVFTNQLLYHGISRVNFYHYEKIPLKEFFRILDFCELNINL